MHAADTVSSYFTPTVPTRFAHCYNGTKRKKPLHPQASIHRYTTAASASAANKEALPGDDLPPADGTPLQPARAPPAHAGMATRDDDDLHAQKSNRLHDEHGAPCTTSGEDPARTEVCRLAVKESARRGKRSDRMIQKHGVPYPPAHLDGAREAHAAVQAGERAAGLRLPPPLLHQLRFLRSDNSVCNVCLSLLPLLHQLRFLRSGNSRHIRIFE